MSKAKKIILRVVPIFLVLLVMSTSVFGMNLGTEIATQTGSIGSVDATVGKIWNTVLNVLRMVAVAAIVIAGIRYMFASADTKADIKTQIIWLVVGAAFVFAGATIVEFVLKVTNDIF